jgi:hypothetical protein
MKILLFVDTNLNYNSKHYSFVPFINISSTEQKVHLITGNVP